MVSTSSHINVSLDGDSLYIKKFGDDSFETIIVFFHDIGEYHARYEEFAKHLEKNKISTLFIDLRGHGLSTGARGVLDSYEKLVHDNRYFYEYLIKNYSNHKFYIAGHGFGALVALDFFVTYSDENILGLINLNPLIKMKNDEGGTFDTFLSKIRIFDKIKISHGLRSKKMSSNLEVSRQMLHDPLINKKISIGSFRFLNALVEKSKSNIYYVTKRTFIGIGLENQFLDIKSCELFIMSIDKNVLELKYYDSLGHEIFNELAREELFNDVVNWINDRELEDKK